LKIEGEPIVLPADIATPLGLVLHELATNAARHGALSNRTGKVTVTWASSRRNNTPVLRFDLEGDRRPNRTATCAKGFGSTLIETAVPNAKVKREFRGDGMVCTIELSWPESVQHAAADSKGQ
jgi:two-component system, chemotaxis family, CheB/CheR fusion protein